MSDGPGPQHPELVVGHPASHRIPPGLQGGAAGGAHFSSGIEVGKPHPLRRHPVQIRGPDRGMAIASQIPVSKVIRQNDNDVRFGSGRSPHDHCDQGNGAAEFPGQPPAESPQTRECPFVKIWQLFHHDSVLSSVPNPFWPSFWPVLLLQAPAPPDRGMRGRPVSYPTPPPKPPALPPSPA